jgi:hypothetical protein
VVAAGGGGDAITAAALAASERRNTGPPVVMTFSWDRLMIDPLPGPRTAADFSGLCEVAPGLFEILASTRPIPPAGSSLPRLAAELPARLFLLDPVRGAVGMAEQITAAADHFRSERVDVLDVGGDALTDGADPGLRSPLADQLALAATVRAGLPCRLLVTGAALDGELPAATITHRLHQLGSTVLPPISEIEAGSVRRVFNWHPSEASGLLAAAAIGLRGRVEVRDAGDQVELTERTAAVSAVDAARAAATTPADKIGRSASLDEADRLVHRATGVSEIDYERRKATRRDAVRSRRPTLDDLGEVDGIAAEVRVRGCRFITIRRLAELFGAVTLETFTALSELLSHHRPMHYMAPVYRTDPPPHDSEIG